ncbi:putative c6 finger domain [Phaeomoniella chlamydospora]|uniref:Putative c6 finger domain n=1 Tax=Phaeomoniella chlamydospora TaxID=158046 RepID=A0A0G2DYC8_PHACM|nr:putative c6 finger domain [Phaeomoniella chlamydospora]
MDLLNLIATERPRQKSGYDTQFSRDNLRQSGPALTGSMYSQPLKQGSVSNQLDTDGLIPAGAGVMNAQRAVDAYQQHLTRGTTPKKVAFELILDDDTKQRARIPLRVLINQHDSTESIVSTVKNFYGIYEGRGVSFEDAQGNILIAKYENFKNDMVVYVRVIPYDNYIRHHTGAPPYHVEETFPKPTLGEPFQMLPPQSQPLDSSQVPSRPTSRLARNRSTSPNRDRRSASSQKSGSRPGIRSRDASTHGSYQDEAANGYSDSDNGHGSTTSSKKGRGEQFTADISLENIMQDGRRMRPKFDSSELPLFVPPQVPLAASSSSISPQRRSIGQEGPSPFARPAQKPYQAHQQTLPSPQSLGNHEQLYSWQIPTAPGQTPQAGPRLRERTSAQSMSNLSSGRGGYGAQGILPTPDPTIASCISDEDVARQLIALGDASNFSHGRASASTADDAFSGIADVASSTGATSDGESDSDEELPRYPRGTSVTAKKRHDSYASESDEGIGDDEYRDSEALIKSEYDDFAQDMPKAKKLKTKASEDVSDKSRTPKTGVSSKISKAGTSRSISGPKKSRSSNGSIAPGVQPPRKTSSVSTTAAQQLAADEEDLSSKPRCQRCRKSKKGCDRQRPCQRCKDAGIGAEGCISEDEGNGRKGRYGRHMGVTIKKTAEPGLTTEGDDFRNVGVILTGMAAGDSPDKGKKRKR